MSNDTEVGYWHQVMHEALSPKTIDWGSVITNLQFQPSEASLAREAAVRQAYRAARAHLKDRTSN
jgi:hypothetical protein